MKDTIIKYIAALLIIGGTGAGVYNHTGTDIVLENGEVLKTHNLTESLTKHYRNRDITDSLTIVVHHTAASGKQRLENIAKFHVEVRGWPAIAYHAAITPSGEIHLLNDIEERTYHNSADNTNTIGVVFLGNFEEEQPTPEAIAAFKSLADAMCLNLKIKGIKGHRDYKSTLCPGLNLYVKLKHENIIN